METSRTPLPIGRWIGYAVLIAFAIVSLGPLWIAFKTALTGPNALDPLAAGNFVLKPVVVGTGQLDWTCNAAAGSTIIPKYLPAICRQ